MDRSKLWEGNVEGERKEGENGRRIVLEMDIVGRTATPDDYLVRPRSRDVTDRTADGNYVTTARIDRPASIGRTPRSILLRMPLLDTPD